MKNDVNLRTYKLKAIHRCIKKKNSQFRDTIRFIMRKCDEFHKHWGIFTSSGSFGYYIFLEDNQVSETQ